MTNTSNQQIIIAEIFVKWNNTLEKDLHNRMVYVLSKVENFTDEEIRAQITSWLELENTAYTETKITSMERVSTSDEAANIMHSPKLVNGFVHVDMETNAVHYYAPQPDEDDQNGDIMQDFQKN